MAKKRRKKVNLRLKKTARRTIAAVLMISAIIIAMIPIPEVQADAGYNVTDTDKIVINNGITLSADGIAADDIHNALVIGKMSDNTYQLDWQFKFFMQTVKGSPRGVISEYNSTYQKDTVNLNPNVTYEYYKVTTTEYNDFYTAQDATEKKSNEPEAGDYKFFLKYFESEYKAWVEKYNSYTEKLAQYTKDKKAYDAYVIAKAYYETDLAAWIASGSPEGSKPIAPAVVTDPGAEPTQEPFIKKISDLSTTQKKTYYCDVNMTGMDCSLVEVIDASAGGVTNVTAYVANGGNGNLDEFGFQIKSRSTIIAIGDKAFEQIKNVYYLNLPQEIKYIGEEAFMNSFIRTVSFDNVENIGNRAFKGCTQLSQATLKDGTSIIGTEAFYGSGITSISLPYSVGTIGPGAFAYCQKLASADLSAVTQPGCTIGKSAFYDDTALNSVSFGKEKAITSIGDGAFAVESGITGAMTEFTFPTGLSATNSFGDYMLAGRTNLLKVTLPADFGRSTAVTLPEHTFTNCMNLENVEFPADGNGSCGLVTFSDKIFADVINESFYVRGPELDRASAKAAPRKATWATKNKLGKPIPYVYTKDSIDYYEVSDSVYLLTVNTKGELTSCELVDSTSTKPINLVIPSQVGTYKVTSIANGCFSAEVITYLTTLTIEDNSISAIGDGVFQGAKALTTVVIGNSVNAIGANAFKDCISLTDVTFHTPASYSDFTIGADAFATGSTGLLTFHGDIVVGYAPFEWAMNKDNYMNAKTGRRVCYRSGAPTNLTVLRDNSTDLVTLVDYPHYSNIDADNADYCKEMHEYFKANYKDYSESSFSILNNYENVFVNGKTPAHDWENVNDDMLAIVNSTKDIEVPAGIQSIDANHFFNASENSANLIYVTGTDPGDVNGDLKKTLYAGAGSEDIHPGLFSGNILDYKPAVEGNEAVQKGNDRITSVVLHDVISLPDYAFDDCEKLQYVNLGICSDIGKAPFLGCESLENISENETYSCQNGIVYSKNEDGTLTLETCLSTRGNLISPRTITTASDPLLANVSEINDGAFQNCDDITRIDLSDAIALKVIPEYCFNSCASLYEVALPESVNTIKDKAFTDNIKSLRVTIPGTEVQITHDAFDHGQGVIRTYENSAAFTYAELYKIDTEIIGTKYKVTFIDWDGSDLCEDQYVESGKDAEPPEDPKRDGYIFDGWSKSYKAIVKDTIIMATYVSSGEIKVSFLDWDGKELSVQYVAAGGTATAPANPTRTDYTFSGWSKTFSNITEETTIIALYTPNGTSGSGGTGSNGSGSSGSGGSSSSDSDSKGSGSSSSDKTYHKLIVTGGSGGGFYQAGTLVSINAFAPPDGQNFHQWTSTSNGVGFANAYNRSTTLTMPANTATVVANFGVGTASSNNTVTDPAKPSTGGGSGSGGSGGSGGSSGSGSNSTGTKAGGTVVSITKPGFSDTDKATAVVHGSTDNYIIKITEDADAQAQIEAALLTDTETLENIKYFPMDISLYDSTGTKKITDTAGLTIDITLPLPDELREYGGNNKVAGVVNGSLDKLTPTFKSIDGVPCVTFTASHFSPYTIYVDTANLSDGSIDSSPKTGDPIHPKWFLAIGLASISIFLFLKKDRRRIIKIS